MRVLVTGSRLFMAGYRIDRALVRASANQETMRVMTVGRRWRNGAEAIARDMALEFGWETERFDKIVQARPEVCLAFLHYDDLQDESQRIVMKCEKAGIPVWRYYEGGPRSPHFPSPSPMNAACPSDEDEDYDYESDLAPWEEELLRPVMSSIINGQDPLSFTVGDVTYNIIFDEAQDGDDTITFPMAA